jgi:hypothetical protein
LEIHQFFKKKLFLISVHQNDMKIQKKIEVKKKIKIFQILKKVLLKRKNKQSFTKLS